METSKSDIIKEFTPEELLGPLKDIEKKYAPSRLYVSGNTSHIPILGPRCSIIGSREASPEGLNEASDIAKNLVKKGITIVSGLAKGIDTAAHKATIEEDGHTIAVLGTPLNYVYPKENSQLQDIIKQNHLAITQFPIGYSIQPKNFILRNRTMALISNASIIVEAGEKSGTLHQGWESLRLGRPLFIGMSVLNDSSLSWPKKMIEYGAFELTSLKEVIDVLPPTNKIINMSLLV